MKKSKERETTFNLDLKSLDPSGPQPGNTIGDRLELVLHDLILGKAMEKYHIEDQINKNRAKLQHERVEIYKDFFIHPPVMKRPLLICLECLLIWSPVFDPLEPIPLDIGRCPNGCNEHFYNERKH